MAGGSGSRIPLQVSRQCVVASIQLDLTAEVLRQFRADLLGLLHDSGCSGVILDVSGVQIMDFEDFEALRRTMAMAALMGAQTIVSGLRAGVVSSLVELGADTEDIVATLDLDDAFRVMDELRSAARDELEEEDNREQSVGPLADPV
jgi:rsbT antagonist protein RsbS